jgi:alginate O-acetyltransferase complex protein AlgI
MLFNSLPFLFAFLPIVYLVFWRLRSRQARYVWLTVTGYVFYGFWDYRFCTLMAFSTLVSYVAGRGMLAHPHRKKLYLWLAVATDLALLGFFKYAGFAVRSAIDTASFFGYTFTPPAWNIVLPIGISFYTFHTITYIVDSYRGVITPTKNLFEFSAYVSLFAQLVAGPIVRFRQIEADLDDLDAAEGRRDLDKAWSFFVLGLIKKVLIADGLAMMIDPLWGRATELSTPEAWLAAIGYTYQLYFDFSGYSDMAVGLGLMFGLRLPQNFDSPYKAHDIADFWRRWHISLSSILRDYLYIPLGGSRHGELMTYRNLMLTMLLGGLWHGAAWTFVIWGGYHGLLLCLNRLFGDRLAILPLAVRQTVTFSLVIVGWVWFRAATLQDALTMYDRMFILTPNRGGEYQFALIPLLAVAAFVAHGVPNTFQMKHRWGPATGTAIGALLVLVMLVLYAGGASPFLYFQF